MMKIQNGKKDTTRFQKHFYGFGDGKNDKRYFVLDKNDRLIRSRYERIDSLNGIEKVMHINHGHTGINDTTRITTIEQKGEAFPGFSTNNFTTRIENGDTTSVTSQTTLTIDSLNTTEIYMVHNFQQNLITKSVWHTLKNKYKKMMIYEYRRGVWKLTRIIDTKMNEYGKEYLIIDYAPITKKTTIRLNEFEYY